MVLPVIKQTILTFSEILNLEGHLNCCIGSKFTSILLKGDVQIYVQLWFQKIFFLQIISWTPNFSFNVQLWIYGYFASHSHEALLICDYIKFRTFFGGVQVNLTFFTIGSSLSVDHEGTMRLERCYAKKTIVFFLTILMCRS